MITFCKNQGVNAIVVLAHTGVSTYKGKTSGEAVDILKKLYKIDPNNSVDLYVAAHSSVCKWYSW